MSQLLSYETIVKASEGDPEAVAAVLSHYAGWRYEKKNGGTGQGLDRTGGLHRT